MTWYQLQSKADCRRSSVTFPSHAKLVIGSLTDYQESPGDMGKPEAEPFRVGGRPEKTGIVRKVKRQVDLLVTRSAQL